MKKTYLFLIGILITLTFVLSACAPGPRVTGSPGLALSGDQLFVSYGNFLYALNADSGALQWSFPESSSNQILFFAPPMVTQDYVFVGDVAKNFYKIDRKTGASVWTFSDAKGYFIAQANEENGQVYAPNNDGNLYALDENGNLKWVFETGHFLWAQPQIGSDAIYLGAMDGFIYAISMEGEQLWATEMAGAVVASPTLSEDSSMLFVGSIGKDFSALNTSDGSVAWSFTASDGIWGNALLVDGVLYTVDSSGTLYILDPATGDQKEQVALSVPVVGGLSALPDGISLVTEEGNIKVLNLDGSPRWEVGISGNVFQAPVVNDKYLMVAAVKSDNLVYAYNLTTNAQVWSNTPKK